MLKLIQEPNENDSPLTELEWTIISDRLGVSPRELQIVRWVMADAKELTIARRLGISPHTVHTYLKRLYLKLAVSSRTELVLRIFSEYAVYMRRENSSHQTSGGNVVRRAA